MEWIVITSPGFLQGEADFIDRLFGHGLDRLHLRKPGADIGECRRLLDGISREWLPRIVVHDNFGLCREYGLGGVHLNGRNPMAPPNHEGSVSRSCHSLEEISRYKGECDYLTLSPIFNSISKQGYMAAFGPGQLAAARDSGLIDRRVMALAAAAVVSVLLQLGECASRTVATAVSCHAALIGEILPYSV